jgi:AraC-like DNA-binding protein
VVKGESGIEHLAKATGTSVRTLQRRLKDAAVNYSDLQNDVRKTLALNLLENETLEPNRLQSKKEKRRRSLW